MVIIKPYIICATLLLIPSPSYALIASSEIKQKAFKAEWDFEKQKQRFASRCLAYYRPNEAAWTAYLKETFGDEQAPSYDRVWYVWKEYEAPFLEDELPYDKYPEFKTLREKLKSLGGYPSVGHFENFYNLKWLREQIKLFEILNVQWDTYKKLTGKEPKISIMFDVKSMSKAINRNINNLASPKSSGTDQSDNGNFGIGDFKWKKQ